MQALLVALVMSQAPAELRRIVDAGVLQQGSHAGPMQQFVMTGLLAPVSMDGGSPSGGFGGAGTIVSSRGLRAAERPVLAGSLSKEELKAGLQPQLRAIRLCYEQTLKNDGPSSGGVLKIFFVIGPKGEVTDAGVESAGSGVSRALQSCVVEAVKKVKTVPPRGGVVRVVYPFTFSPGE